MNNKLSVKKLISSILLCVLWLILFQIPLHEFQWGWLDSIWPGVLFIALFVVQPLLIYTVLKGFRGVFKSAAFIAICVSLLTGLSFQKLKLLYIEELLKEEGVLIVGFVKVAETHNQRLRSTKWKVQACYEVAGGTYLTPVYVDPTTSLQIKDAVNVLYVASYPELSRIKH
jgi:hypothetical protein